MVPEVVVLGKNYLTPLGVVRSLARAGYRVRLLFIANREGDSRIVAASQALTETVEVIGRNDDSVLEMLETRLVKPGQQRILFPTDDYTALLIDRNRKKLSADFLMPRCLEESVSRMMDKSVQGQIARECGLRTAREWIVPLNTEPVQIPTDMVYPCFVKPLVSAEGGKSELGSCGSREALEKKLSKMQMRSRERSVLIQEFLPIIQEYTIGGVCNDQEIILPALIRKTRVAQHNRGVTLSGIVVSRDELGEDLAKITAFLQRVRFIGLMDLEVIRTEKGLYFGELNLRCGGPCYAYQHCGVNLPALAAEAICGKRPEWDSGALMLNRTFVNDKVAWEDYADLHLGKAEMRKLLQGSDFTLLREADDPGPEACFNRTVRSEYRKRRCRKAAGKLMRRMLGKKGG